MSHNWQTLAEIRGTDVTAKLAAERAPVWAADYITRLEHRLAEARMIADSLATVIEPAPGVVEMLDYRTGAVIRFRPGAIVRVYTGEADDHRSRFEIRADRHDSSRLEVSSPDARHLAALGSGGVNVLTLLALED